MSEVLSQDYRHLFIPYESVAGNGVPRTGLSPTTTIQRSEDLLFWSDINQTWQVASESITIPEVDATEIPGKYKYFLGPNAVNLIDGAKGYSVIITETDFRVTELVDIVQTAPDETADAVWEEPRAEHTTTGSMGEVMPELPPTTKITAG